jgi:hypothetical protein
MKKTFFQILVMLILLVSACSQKSTECLTCNEAPSTEALITMNLFSDSSNSLLFPVKYWQSDVEKEKHNFFASAVKKVDQNVLQKGVEYLKSQNMPVADDEKIAIIIFYVDVFISKNTNISKNNIKAVSVYSLNNNILQHKIFRKVETSFSEIKEKRGNFNSFSMSYANDFLNEEIIPTNTPKSQITVMGMEFVNFLKNRKKNIDISSISDYYNRSYIESGVTFMSAGKGCGVSKGCESEVKYTNCEGAVDYFTFELEFRCNPKECAAGRMSETLQENGSTFSPINFNLMYQFRDEFLSQYNGTKKYINQYYHFSSFLSDKMNLQVIIKTINTLQNFYPVMEILLDSNNNANSIVINESLKNQLLDLINDYKGLSTDSDYRQALDDLVVDVNHYSNRTVSYIVTSISQ